ncbi:HlyD family secretion protein [Modicisalibacter xianhensis]|uniref:HlyD family secretion protein n=1 Tax=Modicisalibacter xianhensis TaxID=442341 RepID=A0A4R8G8F3_9GAMM|nr:HlyD family efflux transporter periplasmic adaptor subunit [Halomonas xianhensis]TDX32958.1 HlyD family secretion protein [Halomonas xianhensis]
MADEHIPNVDNRNEPTLGNSRNTRSQPGTGSSNGVGGQLNHERRDERRHVRIDAPFQVKLEDGRSLPGHDLSLGGFSIHSDKPFEEGRVASMSLLLMAGSAELIVPVTARALRNQSERKGNSHEIAFEIVKIDQRHRELLRRVIRSHLSGRYAAIEDLIEREDPQTPRKRNTRAAAAQTSKTKKPWGRYSLLILAGLTLVAVAAATAYRNFMLIEPSFAAVTAPRVDIRAPGPGILAEHDLQAGDKVKRDQKLTEVNNSDLQTQLILAKASYTYNQQLIENMREAIEAPGDSNVTMPESTSPSGGEPSSYESVSPEVARARIEQFETARDFESSRIDALEARVAANTIYSPCDCQVAWALSSAGGTWINESERIMTLLRTGPNDVMAEALVHMSDIARIEPHQKAYIALPNASEPIEATVRTIALDVESQPRAGFPKWVRQQQNVASVLLVPEEPLPASAVGVPVDVRFSEVPLVDATAEWVWQGGRAIYQQATDLIEAVLPGDGSTTGTEVSETAETAQSSGESTLPSDGNAQAGSATTVTARKDESVENDTTTLSET